MHKLVSQLVVYRNLPADNLLEPLAAICARFAGGSYNREELTAEIYEQVHKLLDIGTVYGFDKIFGIIIWRFCSSAVKIPLPLPVKDWCLRWQCESVCQA